MRIAVIIIMIFTWSLPGFGNSYVEQQKSDAVQTHIENHIPFNAPSEYAHFTVLAKVFFVDLSFLIEQILDLPGQQTIRNPAIYKNSYQHNTFYVLLTAKAP